MRVLIIGSNPSTESKNKKIPFEGAKSNKKLQAWIQELGLNEFEIINVSDKRTPHKVPLKKSEYQLRKILLKAKKYDKVIALGNTASDALTILGLEHHKIDHPSPINRRLQNEEYVKGMIERCKNYLNT